MTHLHFQTSVTRTDSLLRLVLPAAGRTDILDRLDICWTMIQEIQQNILDILDILDILGILLDIH